ncbi:hypothetical protein B5807_00786 [Epicoccum nigrum]|uniref:EthD domain-containing protein n=1 Tax=Epicoccum nigrum TaxID=105696 RepID=A0A1Y2MD06_EPING|nr:hypothetical protein B5807_00786 [Epicoccum nigrum]
MSTEGLIRISVFANRNPSLSEEEFHAHWTEKHGPLVSSWLQKHGIIRYTQYHTPASHGDYITQNFSIPTLSYDGVADFYVKSLEDFKEAYEDPYYEDVVKKDEEYLFDVKNMRIMVGTETRIIEGSKIVQDHSQTK